MPAPNGSMTAINGANQGEGFCYDASESSQIQLTEAREHPVE